MTLADEQIKSNSILIAGYFEFLFQTLNVYQLINVSLTILFAVFDFHNQEQSPNRSASNRRNVFSLRLIDDLDSTRIQLTLLDGY